MGARRRRVAVGMAATFLLLAACGDGDADETVATVPASATDSPTTTATTSSTSTTSTTVPPTTAAPPITTAETAAPETTEPETTTPETTEPETTVGALVLSWTSSGPPARGCFEPGETVPDLEVNRAPDSEPLGAQVDIIDWQFEPSIGEPLTWTANYSDDRVVLTFAVIDAPRPWSVELTLGYSSQGPQVFVTDEPEVFRWTFEDTCG